MGEQSTRPEWIECLIASEIGRHATARAQQHAELLTCDTHFEALPGLIAIPKRPPAP